MKKSNFIESEIVIIIKKADHWSAISEVCRMRGHRTPLSTIGLSQFQKFHSQQAPCKSAECLRSCYLRKIFRCAGKKFISIFVGPDTRFVSNKLDHDALFCHFCQEVVISLSLGHLGTSGNYSVHGSIREISQDKRRYGEVVRSLWKDWSGTPVPQSRVLVRGWRCGWYRCIYHAALSSERELRRAPLIAIQWSLGCSHVKLIYTKTRSYGLKAWHTDWLLLNESEVRGSGRRSCEREQAEFVLVLWKPSFEDLRGKVIASGGAD